MTEPTIQEMNEVIALFDGYEKYEDSDGVWFKKEGQITCMHTELKDLKYHTSWDWLMPVVEKIHHFNIGPTFGPISVHISVIGNYEWSCHILGDLRTQHIDEEGMHSYTKKNYSLSIRNKDLIMAVHESVYQFILWYNSINKTTHP